MTKYCCAPGCLNVLNQNKNITFHRFPHKRPDILEKWILATRIKNFEANLFAMICSEHFTPDCYTTNNLHRKILKKEAIPTIFKITNEKMKNCNKPDIKGSESCSSDKDITQKEGTDEESKQVEEVKTNSCKSEKNLIEDGWFKEKNCLWPGRYLALKVETVLCSENTKYQDVMVIQTADNGKAVILDGSIRCTENDEFAYHEMISFLPLCAHSNPAKVLIVGGGNGGIAREVDKHPLVKEIAQIEIDQKLIDISKEYLPSIAEGFNSSKLDLKIGDGLEYLKSHKKQFDVIISDSNNTIGVVSSNLTDIYFSSLKESLNSDGILCMSGGSIWTQIDQVKNFMNTCRKYFKEVRYATISLPTCPTGQVGFFLASSNETTDLTTPKHQFSTEELEKYNLKYYSSGLHSACFVLPNFAKKVLDE